MSNPGPASQTPPNPLAALCRQLGLTVATVARLAGVAPSAVREALADPPASGAVAAYIAAAEALGARLRCRPAPPLTLWVDRAFVDDAYSDDGFRARVLGLPPMPPTRYALRREVVRLKKKRGLTHGQIVDHLQRGRVCTAEGLRGWRRGTITQLLRLSRKHRVAGDDLPVSPGADALAEWRGLVLQALLGRACGDFDPFAPVRYGLLPAVDEPATGRLLLPVRGRMPERVEDWLLEGLSLVTDLAGQWGVLRPGLVVAAGDSGGAMSL